MKGRVIFFPLKHLPDEITMSELMDIQDRLNQYNQEVRWEETNDYNLAVRTQQVANIFRSKWVLIDTTD